MSCSKAWWSPRLFIFWIAATFTVAAGLYKCKLENKIGIQTYGLQPLTHQGNFVCTTAETIRISLKTFLGIPWFVSFHTKPPWRRHSHFLLAIVCCDTCILNLQHCIVTGENCLSCLSRPFLRHLNRIRRHNFGDGLIAPKELIAQ